MELRLLPTENGRPLKNWINAIKMDLISQMGLPEKEKYCNIAERGEERGR